MAWVLQSAPSEAQTFRFNRVVIEGNQRIGDGAILSRAGIARGQTISAGQLNDAFQNLNNSGLFESVEVIPAGNTLRIVVVEFPTINRVSFEGNRRIKDEALGTIVQSAERQAFNPTTAERDAAAIAEAYSNDGRLAARVSPRIIRRSDNRVDLVFEIFEGDVVEIERLSFVGNRVFSDRRLRRVLETKQAGLFRTFIRQDTFVADRIEFDKQVLRDFYLSRGYVDFRTNSVNAELAEERDGYFLTFNVQEGQQFRFGEITTISDLSDVDPDVYQSLIKIRPGVVYSPTLVEAEIARMERQAIRTGVNFLRVEPRISRNDRDLTLDVEFALTRGPRVFVERIDIEGNTTTLDQVIRRQFRVAEGDPFNPRSIRESAERIRALDFFETAEVNAREGSTPDQVIVDVDVVEKPTGSLSFGGSFSANDGFGLAIQFTERNFLGRGQQLGFSFSTAEEAESYGLTFVEPAFLGRDVAFGLRFAYNETESSFATYATEEFIFQPSLTFGLNETSELQLRMTLAENEMTTRSGVNAGQIIQNEIARGGVSTASLGFGYNYDSRKLGLNPDAGVVINLESDIAGLGGDNEYIRSTFDITTQRLAFNGDVVLRATLEGGALGLIGGSSRAVDRFILTPSQFRGFEPGGIGPRDTTAYAGGATNDTLGGNYYLAARFEAEFPLGLPEELGIRGAAFYDVGNLWGFNDLGAGSNVSVSGAGAGDFRHVIGFSILWDTPVGPLRFNFSDALKKEDYDREQSFDFTLSTNF